MVIGIDISQIVYTGTGVGRYVEELVKELLKQDKKNKYILFGSSLRNRDIFRSFFSSLPEIDKKNAVLKLLPLPPTILEFIWNRLHVLSIERIIGAVDVFWSSDWIQPPLGRAKGVTTIHDLSIYRFPESFSAQIVSVHKRKLERSKRVCSFFLCDSQATVQDAHKILNIPLEKMAVVYPGYKTL